MKKKKREETVQPLSHLSNERIHNTLFFLLKHQFSFVAFQFPFKNELQILVQNNDKPKESFHFETFDSLKKTTIKGELYKENDFEKILKLKNNEVLNIEAQEDTFYMCKADYEQYVDEIKQNIAQGNFTKCVAARKVKIEKSKDFNISQSFINMLTKYDGAFRYIANTPFGLWMGATPELLLQQENNKFNTVALAATKTDNRVWTEKEKDEQAIVTQYIVDTLKSNGVHKIETSATYTFKAGHLQHLKTDIEFYSDKVLADKLHPTPAVCGMPLKESRNFILEKEQKNRSLYSGFLGLNGSFAKYYVNLRCMQILDNHIDVYVGAGITASSIPHKEWEETENKAKIMLNILT